LRGGICLMIMPLNLLEEDQVSPWSTEDYWEAGNYCCILSTRPSLLLEYPAASLAY
jgi:hypothetical protein